MKFNFPAAENLPEINELPDLFTGQDGKPIKSVAEWEANRNYFKAMLKHYMYGDIPEGDFKVRGEIIYSERVFMRKAVREMVRIEFGIKERLSFVVEIIRPKKEGRYPAITYVAFPNRHEYATESDDLIKRGYVIAMFNYEQLAPDENITDTPIYRMFGDRDVKAIGLWAFCMSRLIDYLDTTDYTVPNGYIATGHSRNGKAALCAGIFDERIAITVPNNSGCGGCGCFRFLGDRDGMTQDAARSETLQRITTAFPYWFSDNLKQFYDKTPPADGAALNNRLPFDLHLNKALIAPRKLLHLEAYGDVWANTYGSKLTFDAAKKIFELYGKGEHIQMEYREGGHGFTEPDWLRLLEFCDKNR